jgi:DNA-binding transcriptional LysR family regulator
MRFGRIALFSLTLMLVVSTCTPQPTPTSKPQAAYVVTTPAYEDWVKSQVNSYWEVQPGNGVIPLVYPYADGLEKVNQGEVELLISASPPPEGWFATPLQADAIAILVHPDVGIGELSIQQLYDIFFGREENWSAFNEEDLLIQPIIPLEGDEIRTTFQADVLNGARFTSNSILAPHPQAAIALMDDNPGSIAILPWTSVSDEVTPLMLEGVRLSPTNIEKGKYPLTLNVIATAPKEPAGVMRQFLGWLQATLLP